ncbi:MAG: hypothetical protein HYR66_06395 [Sphingobacteriales bacterium]|nr:hypothetical protein [Sphingobacteriales bacterium]MBI3719825.1 hypothetical protein [Sphingobacteriales bacterium]
MTIFFYLAGFYTALRKTVVILLLGCLFVYMGGYWLLGQYQQHVIKEEMEAKIKTSLPVNETKQLVFTVQNGNPVEEGFYWENEDEFHYQDRMYDVISKKIIGDKLFINCINDDKEEELIEHNIDIAKKENNKPGNTSSGMQLILSLVFVSPEAYLIPSFNISSHLPVSAYQFRLLNRSGDIFIPPPQI